MSYKVEVLAGATENWNANSLRFETQEQAESYAQELTQRWPDVREYRVVESEDPVSPPAPGTA
jgi:hypothetical protein